MENAVFNARLQARQEQKSREEKRKLAHARVAGVLRSASDRQPVLAYALEQVAKWRNQGLCSRDYIEEWEGLLARPDQAASVLVEDSPRAVRLRQNTPFAAYLAA